MIYRRKQSRIRQDTRIHRDQEEALELGPHHLTFGDVSQDISTGLLWDKAEQLVRGRIDAEASALGVKVLVSNGVPIDESAAQLMRRKELEANRGTL